MLVKIILIFVSILAENVDSAEIDPNQVTIREIKKDIANYIIYAKNVTNTNTRVQSRRKINNAITLLFLSTVYRFDFTLSFLVLLFVLVLVLAFVGVFTS